MGIVLSIILPDSSKTEIWTMNADGSDAKALLSGIADWDPTWSKDGKFVYFSSDRGGTSNIWRIRINEENGIAIGEPMPITTPAYYSDDVSLNSDGSAFLYTSLDSRANVQRLPFNAQTMKITGATESVTKGTFERVRSQVSPDGKWVAFTSGNAQMDVFIIRSDGTGLRKLTNDIWVDIGVSWSKDSQKIAFISNRSGKNEIWVINKDGGGLKQTSESKMKFSPKLSWLDNKQIIGTCEMSGSMIYDENGGHIEPIVASLQEKGLFYLGTVSPDHSKITGMFIPKDKNEKKSYVTIDRLKQTTDFREIKGYVRGSAWLSDNQRIVVQINNGLFAIDTKKLTRTKIMDIPIGYSFDNISISPDDKYIYFEQIIQESDVWMAEL